MTEASNRKGIAKNNDKFHFYTIAKGNAENSEAD